MPLPGRPDDDHGAEGLGDGAGQGFGGRLAHPEVLQRDRGGAGVHDPERHLFAVRRRQHRDAEVDRTRTGAKRQPSILRRALLGDVQLGHHLQAAGNGRLQVLRDRCELAHDAVDASPDEQAVALGREVDVGSAKIDRAAEDCVHLFDRGRVRRGLAQVDDGSFRLFLDNRLVVEVELAGVDPGDRPVDRFGGSDANPHRRSERNFQVIGSNDVGRVVDSDENRAVFEKTNRDRAVAACQRFAQQTGRADVDRLADEVDEGELVLLGEHPGNLRGGHKAEVDENLAEPLAGGLLVLQGRLELLDGECAVAEQKCS